jgi:hypothetical protein
MRTVPRDGGNLRGDALRAMNASANADAGADSIVAQGDAMGLAYLLQYGAYELLILTTLNVEAELLPNTTLTGVAHCPPPFVA